MSAVSADLTDIDLTVHDRRIAARHAGRDTAELEIPILSATGSGPTTLAAFDSALLSAGIANFNLVRLSSVIPPGTTILDDGARTDGGSRGNWGDRLYCVYARQDATEPGSEAWAGISWVQDPDSGAGLFVEHEGSSEIAVRADLKASINALCRNRGISGLAAHSRVVGAVSRTEPVCAMVIAPYVTAGWS